MDAGLRKYLDKCWSAPVDKAMLDTLHQEMKAAVPEIIKAIRQREKGAAEIRRGCR